MYRIRSFDIGSRRWLLLSAVAIWLPFFSAQADGGNDLVPENVTTYHKDLTEVVDRITNGTYGDTAFESAYENLARDSVCIPLADLRKLIAAYDTLVSADDYFQGTDLISSPRTAKFGTELLTLIIQKVKRASREATLCEWESVRTDQTQRKEFVLELLARVLRFFSAFSPDTVWDTFVDAPADNSFRVYNYTGIRQFTEALRACSRVSWDASAQAIPSLDQKVRQLLSESWQKWAYTTDGHHDARLLAAAAEFYESIPDFRESPFDMRADEISNLAANGAWTVLAQPARDYDRRDYEAAVLYIIANGIPDPEKSIKTVELTENFLTPLPLAFETCDAMRDAFTVLEKHALSSPENQIRLAGTVSRLLLTINYFGLRRIVYSEFFDPQYRRDPRPGIEKCPATWKAGVQLLDKLLLAGSLDIDNLPGAPDRAGHFDYWSLVYRRLSQLKDGLRQEEAKQAAAIIARWLKRSVKCTEPEQGKNPGMVPSPRPEDTAPPIRGPEQSRPPLTRPEESFTQSMRS